MKVLCFGSLNIDYVYSLDHLVRKGETVASESLDIYGGGKGLNQSLALARAGAPVFHAGAVGEDGRFLVTLLEASGVQTDCIRVRPDVRTGHAVIQRDRSGDNGIILYSGANRSITRSQVDETLEHFETGDYIVLQNEINELSYLIASAHRRGMTVVLNPAPADAPVLQLPLHLVSYLIVNEIEAAALLEQDHIETDFPDRAVSRLLERFPQSKIVLTLGNRGSIYAETGYLYQQPVFETDVVDTTAAGDCFIGFFLAGIMRRLTIPDAMAQAAQAAAIAVSRAGAAPSIPFMDEVTAAWSKRRSD